MKLAYALSAVTLLVCASLGALGAHDLSEDYRFSATLDSNGAYQLFWNYDLDEGTISFAVQVQTTGWVGFGLSPNGQMPGSDVVIGWVDDEGNAFFNDRYAEDRSLPPIDPSQDWELVSGEEENGTTILEFTRKLITCDDKDLDIEPGTVRLVWSWHSNDPVGGNTFSEHEYMGNTNLDILGGQNEQFVNPPDTKSFVIRNHNVTIPGDRDTTYWCSGMRLPEELQEQEVYIFKFSPFIAEEARPYVHHLTITACPYLSEEDLGPGVDCDEQSQAMASCQRTSLLAGWAVGGGDLIYDDGLGVPLGGPNGGQMYAVLEMHYDNPGLVSGVIDNSGMEVFYTHMEPEHLVGILAIGHTFRGNLVIPPGLTSYTIEGVCTAGCTQVFLPPEGITFVGNGFHTHIAGRSLEIKHYRKNKECDVWEELKPIDIDRNYDFNYQTGRELRTRTLLLPGDVLSLLCTYETLDRQAPVYGGESTHEEMCFSYLAYYPRLEVPYCLSRAGSGSFESFEQEYIDPSKYDYFNYGLDARNATIVQGILNEINWNTSVGKDLEDKLRNSEFVGICRYGEGQPAPQHVFPDNHTVAQCSYQEANTCTGFVPVPCCERLGMSGSGMNGSRPNGSPPVTATCLSLLLGFIVATLALLA